MTISWEEFVKQHAHAVLTCALRVLGNAADADDVAQDVFLEIFRQGRISQFASQPALMRSMATRRALDRLRRRKPTNGIDSAERDRREHEPSAYAIAAELDRQLRLQLAQLPAREAEVFCLTVFENCSAAEVAGILGTSTGAVAKSLCMARRRLAESFGMSRSEAKR
jgi:RNA polymerase sigma-70 factor, ECF subfamily